LLAGSLGQCAGSVHRRQLDAANSTCAISSLAKRSPQVLAMSADEDLFAQRRAEVLRLAGISRFTSART
jgi:hypothetical protein